MISYESYRIKLLYINNYLFKNDVFTMIWNKSSIKLLISFYLTLLKFDHGYSNYNMT